MTLQIMSHNNWLRIPPRIRTDCLNVLAQHVPIAMKATWRDEFQRGAPVGDIGFHMFGGMSVRNILRKVLLDEELPDVMHGNQPIRNWDDFYMGALQDFVETPDVEPSPQKEAPVVDQEKQRAAAQAVEAARKGKPTATFDLSVYHEDFGPVLWWFAGEPPYIGMPNDSDFPKYCLRWSPLPAPPEMI